MRNPEAIRESYKLYRKKGGRLDYSTYLEILRRFNLGLAKLIIKEGYSFRIPFNLGVLQVVQFKQDCFTDGKLDKGKIKINWGDTIKMYMKKWNTSYVETKKLMKEKRLAGETLKYLYHFNDVMYRSDWKKHFSIKNKHCFKFEAVRSFSKAISKEIKNKPIYTDNTYVK